MNRSDRLLSLVAKLQKENWQRAEDLAETFGVSVRTIYRDMQMLEEAGVPVVAIPGKGYRLGERANPSVQPYGWQVVPSEVFEDHQALLQHLRRALADQCAIRFHDRNGAGGEHTVHPYGLLRRSGRWQFVGYDRERGQVRHFPLHEIARLEVLDEHFKRPSGYGLPHMVEESSRDVTVRVRFGPPAALWVQETPPIYTERIEQQGGAVILTLKVRNEADILPWLLGWGAHVRVLEPAALQRRLATEAQKVAEQYQTEPELLS